MQKIQVIDLLILFMLKPHYMCDDFNQETNHQQAGKILVDVGMPPQIQ